MAFIDAVLEADKQAARRLRAVADEVVVALSLLCFRRSYVLTS
jgi:hypothetical protein